MKILIRFLVSFFCLFFFVLPIRAEEVAGQCLFPVYGVSLGKTTVNEIMTVELTESEKGLETEGTFSLDSMEFSYEELIITMLKIDKDRPMPLLWKNAGFEWSLSYQSWISLLENLGFSIKTTLAPTLQIKEDHPVLECQFEAFFSTDYPIVFTFIFRNNRGTGVTSGNVLDQIEARYIPDFEEFNTDTKNKNKEPNLLDESKRKALALTGIEATVNGLSHERLELVNLNQESTEYWKKVLAEEWGISKRSQLLEKIAFLESKGDSQVYQDLVRVINENPDMTINEMGIKLNYDNIQIKRLYFIKEKQDLIGDRALRARDYSRGAFLSRIGYQVGFLSANEAWVHLRRILTKVEGLYQSWEDYASNYIMGLFFEASEVKMEYEKINQALQAYAELTNREGSIWRLPWNGINPEPPIIGNILEDTLYFPSDQYQAWTNYINGWECYLRGEYEGSLDFYKKGLTLDPEFTHLWLLIAMVYSAQTDFIQAVEAFNEYFKGNPDDYLPRIYLAEVYEKNNQIEEALNEYNKAIDLDDAKPEGFVGLGRIALNSGDYELAISYFRIAESLYLTGNESIFYTLYLLGYSYYKIEKFDKALSYFLRAYGNYAEDMYLNYYLGVCYLYNQNFKLALTYINQAEELGLELPQEVKDLLTKKSKP